jgi:ABC-2 type transport system ATP-binding protein
MIRFERAMLEQGGRIVIDGLSLDVPAGRAVALIGPTAAGKSSLLAGLATAIPLRGGDITVCGHSIRREAARVRRLIGYVPARLAAWPSARAGEFLELFATSAGLSGRPLRTAIDRALAFAGLGGGDRVDGLSDGQAKRLLVARAVLHDPEVLVLDDPFGSLAPADRRDIERLIGDATVLGRTVVAAIDDCVVPDCFSHLAVLAEGRLVAEGPAVPGAFSAGRTWSHRITCPGRAVDAAGILQPLAEEVLLIDADTLDCRTDPSGIPFPKLIEALVRSGIPVESAGYHPPWTAQLV